MKKSGELKSVQQVLGGGPSTFQWVGSVLRKAVVWGLGDNYSESELSVEERLVVIPFLQVCCFATHWFFFYEICRDPINFC
jgi:hypothetical protein